MTDSAETMRAHKHVTLNADGDIWTAGIDIRENNGDWHYSAVECHSVGRELAIARRDTVFAALSASGTKSDGAACGDSSQASQQHNADLQPSPSDPIPSQPDERPVCKLCGLEDGACICRSIPKQPQPDEREAIARIIDPRPWADDYPKGSIGAFNADGRKERVMEKATAILAMQAERRGVKP